MTLQPPTPAPPSPTPAPKKAGAGRWILRTLLGLFLLILLALVILYFSIDGIIRSKVQAAAANSTGQTTALASAKLQLSGTLTLNGLDIHNPAGFTSANFVQVPKTVISVQPSSLLSNTLIVHDIEIDGLTLTLEQNGLKNNLADILAFTHQQAADTAATTGSGQAGKSKQLDIAKLRLTNVTVIASGFGVQQTLKLQPIEMDHPTDPDGRLMKVADLTARILEQVATQIATNPQLPPALRKGLGDVSKYLPDAAKLLNNPDLLKNPLGAATQIKGLDSLLKKK